LRPIVWDLQPRKVGAEGEAQTCEECQGRGAIECKECDGKGTIEKDCDECDGQGNLEKTTKCQECDGEGSIESQCEACEGNGSIECEICHGTGKHTHPRTRLLPQRFARP